VDVDFLDIAKGESVELDKVLMISNGETTQLGSPVIDGARVMATSMGTVRGDKIVVFRYKNKTRYRRKTGSRATQTRLTVDRVVMPGE
jgi:large subunit ribosomal protein L21